MLRLLRENHLYAKINKYRLFHIDIHYFGHVISKEGIEVEPKNIKAIIEWPSPRNVDETISFMGLAGYYRGFMKNFSWISYPIGFLQ